MTAENEEEIADLDNLAYDLSTSLRAPVLIMYYFDGQAGIITEDDVMDLYDAFRNRGWKRTSPAERLFVLLNSYGGDPNAGYRLAQIIRSFASNVIFLIPYHATSAATLMSLAANRIVLGPFGSLGAIDITRQDMETGREVELASIMYFRKFVLDTRMMLEQRLKGAGSDSRTRIDSRMMVELIDQVSALEIGSLYRESSLTMYYAIKLMTDYMFAHLQNRNKLATNIANQLVNELPAHDFVLDYSMCKMLNLPVSQMPETLFDRTRILIYQMQKLIDDGVICRDLAEIDGSPYKAPFLRLYDYEERRARSSRHSRR